MQRHHGLLLTIIDGDKSTIGTGDCIKDDFCVIGVVFVAFDVEFDELRSHKLDGVAQAMQLTCPVVGAGASFHSDQRGRSVGKEGRNLVSFGLILVDGLAQTLALLRCQEVGTILTT